MKNGKSGFLLFIIVMSSIIVGGFLGEFFKDSSLLGFLSWGFPIGIMDPLVIDMKMLKLTFGMSVNVNFASISTLIIGSYLYMRS